MVMDQPNAGFGEKGATGITRILRAFRYSMDGIGSALQHEAAFRQELALAVIMIPVAFFVPVDWTARALLIASVMLVLIVELLNSALEAAVDYISKEEHHLAKRAKDMGSAAVFVSLCASGTVWAMALWSCRSLLAGGQ